MRCTFCFADGDVPRLTKEHLLSQPVAEAFGLDRSAAFGHVGDAGKPVILTQLSEISVKMACERCNNGWMNDLEHAFSKLSSWASSTAGGLTNFQILTLKAWGLKTYIVLSEMVGETRRFAENPEAPGVIPTYTRARQLFEKDPRAFDGMAFGLAKPYQPGRFAYVFGTPTVVPQGPGYASRKSAGAAIVTLGKLQVWIVDPTIFHAARIKLPTRVRPVQSGVTYGEMRRRLIAWAEAQPFGLSRLRLSVSR